MRRPTYCALSLFLLSKGLYQWHLLLLLGLHLILNGGYGACHFGHLVFDFTLLATQIEQHLYRAEQLLRHEALGTVLRTWAWLLRCLWLCCLGCLGGLLCGGRTADCLNFFHKTLFLLEIINYLTFYQWVFIPVGDGLRYLMACYGATLMGMLTDKSYDGHACLFGLLLALGVDVECDWETLHIISLNIEY